jgi:hypothetical protein
MNEQHGRAFAPHLDREVYSMHHDPLQVTCGCRSRVHGPAEFLGDRNGAALTIDTNKYKLGTGNQSVIPHPSRGLTHGKAGTPMMSEHLLETEHVAGKSGRAIVDDRLS